MRARRAKLVIPTVLAVTIVAAAPGCGDGGGGSGGGSGGSGGSNPLDTVECYDRQNQADCEAHSVRACTWDGTSCSPDCGAHATQADCEADPTCGWNTGSDECLLPI
jgi:hypothetical protein